MALQVWLPLNRDLRNQGLSNLSFSNNNTSYIVYGNGCYTRTTKQTAGQIISNSTINLNGDLSMACWAKVTECAGDTANGIISNHSHTNNTGFGITVKKYSTTDYRISCSTGNGSSRTYHSYYGTTNIKDAWHHLCLTYDNTAHVFKLWVDGVCEKTQSYTNASRADYIMLFDWSTTYNYNDYRPACSLSDVRIYDHCLSQKEITELSRGCILHYPCNDILNEATTNLVTSLTGAANNSTTVSNGVLTTCGEDKDTYFTINLSESISVGTQYTISCEADMPDDTYWGFPLGTQGNTDLTWRLKQGYNTYTFTANNITWGTKQIFMDDTGGTARTSGYQCKFWNFQLEKKDHATTYTPSSRTQTHLKDVSGFDNHAEIIQGTLPIEQSTGRYGKCIRLDGNTYTRTLNLPSDRLKSYSFWIYLSSYPSRGIVFIGDTTSKMCFSFYNSAYLILACGDSAVSGARFNRNAIPLNKWTHIAANYKGDNHDQIELYINGVKQTANAAEWYTNSIQNGLNIGGRNEDGGIPYTGTISDLRIYTSYLSENDIKDIYTTSLSIDKSQQMHTYELNESDANTNTEVKKNGQLKCKNYYEACPNTYDNNIYTEPDGSQWIKIFHHNNPANALFSYSDSFTTGVYKDADRWFDVAKCNLVNKWELIVKQKATSSDTEKKWRWIQYVNPMIASFEDVAMNNIEKNTISEYNSWYANYGGLRLLVGSGTYTAYLAQNDGLGASNWWGAIGSWSTYQGGIPGINHEIVTSGYEDLYLRIDNLSNNELAALFTEDNEQISRIGKNGLITSKEINEI